LCGKKDSIVFEDDCRLLFGPNAYLLFTLDRVISTLNKHLQSIFHEEVCSKLLAWYSSKSSKMEESVYYASCVDILRDERCFRFESALGMEGAGYITIQYLNTNLNIPAFVDFFVDKQEKWSKHAEEYLNSNPTTVDPKKNKIFLGRNLRRRTMNQSPNLDLIVLNNLEVRVSLKNFRLIFIKNTEDYLYRRGKLLKKVWKLGETKRKKFQIWISSKK